MTSDFDAIERLYQRLGHGIFEAATRTAPLLERDPGERAFLTPIMCGAEIDNGGLDQLFTNSTGEVVELAIEGAHHFGLERHAAVLEEAARLFPNGDVPRGWQQRIDQWEAVRERGGSALDDRPNAP